MNCDEQYFSCNGESVEQSSYLYYVVFIPITYRNLRHVAMETSRRTLTENKKTSMSVFLILPTGFYGQLKNSQDTSSFPFHNSYSALSFSSDVEIGYNPYYTLSLFWEIGTDFGFLVVGEENTALTTVTNETI